MLRIQQRWLLTSNSGAFEETEINGTSEKLLHIIIIIIIIISSHE